MILSVIHLWCFIFFSWHGESNAFGIVHWSTHAACRPCALFQTSRSTETQDDGISFDSLVDMDVVIYTNKDDDTEIKYLGALQENGSLAPLSAWTTEPAYGESLEFLVDEEDRFTLDASKVKIRYLLDQSELSYGSRQCHRGVGNPHGEESERLYYVEQSVVDKFDIQVILKPDLEILW